MKLPQLILLWGLLFSSGIKAADILFLAQDSQPKYLFGDSQSFGLCGDIYAELKTILAKQKISSEESEFSLPVKRIFKMVEHGPNYVFCGANRNAKREKKFTYTAQPIYNVSYVIAHHQNDESKLNSWSDLRKNKGAVGALYGTHSSNVLRSKLGSQVNDTFTSIIEGLELITKAPDRLSFFYYHDLGLNYLIKKYQLPLKITEKKFVTTQQWLIYSKGLDPVVAKAIEQGIDELRRNGQLEKIVKQYIY